MGDTKRWRLVAVNTETQEERPFEGVTFDGEKLAEIDHAIVFRMNDEVLSSSVQEQYQELARRFPDRLVILLPAGVDLLRAEPAD